MPKYKVLEKEKELRAYFIKKRFINRYVAMRTFDVCYLWQCIWRMREDRFEIKTEKGPDNRTRYRLILHLGREKIMDYRANQRLKYRLEKLNQ